MRFLIKALSSSENCGLAIDLLFMKTRKANSHVVVKDNFILFLLL
jgi:hypothetical protein